MSSVGTMYASENYGDKNVPEFVAHLIETSHADKTDHITIAGRRAIQAVIDL